MSYAASAALQEAVYTCLTADPTVATLTGGHVYDALPAGPLPRLYVTLGAESVRDASDATGAGAWHDLSLSVVTEIAGFRAAKDVAGAVSDALVGCDLALARGRLVALQFRTARARRDGALRRIDLTFRARVDAA